MSQVQKTKLLQVLQFPEGDFPIRYLGIPLSPKRLLIRDYEHLIHKMIGRIQAWSEKSLSYAGRLVLLKSVLNSIEQFWPRFFIFLLVWSGELMVSSEFFCGIVLFMARKV